MPRPSQIDDKRRELLPVLAATFAELGYRRTTTAELARRCEVQENILYRIWPDKKKMFVAAIAFVFEKSREIWEKLLNGDNDGHSTAERLLDYESKHHGEFGYYRILFAGWSETDDPEVRQALADMYTRYHRLIKQQIAAHRQRQGGAETPSPELAAWAVLGLATMANMGRELGTFSDRARGRLLSEVGGFLLEGAEA